MEGLQNQMSDLLKNLDKDQLAELINQAKTASYNPSPAQNQ